MIQVYGTGESLNDQKVSEFYKKLQNVLGELRKVNIRAKASASGGQHKNRTLNINGWKMIILCGKLIGNPFWCQTVKHRYTLETQERNAKRIMNYLSSLQKLTT